MRSYKKKHECGHNRVLTMLHLGKIIDSDIINIVQIKSFIVILK